MEYTIRVPKDLEGIIPLSWVVNEIARGAATRWGELPFHEETYKNALLKKTLDVIHAARGQELIVRDINGRRIHQIPDELVTAKIDQRDWQALRHAHPECEYSQASGISLALILNPRSMLMSLV